MKHILNTYFVTCTFLTILLIFSVTFTSFYKEHVLFYLILIVIIGVELFIIESILNKKIGLLKKGKVMGYIVIPVNVLVVLLIIWSW